jgi:hypothetical protein
MEIELIKRSVETPIEVPYRSSPKSDLEHTTSPSI